MYGELRRCDTQHQPPLHLGTARSSSEPRSHCGRSDKGSSRDPPAHLHRHPPLHHRGPRVRAIVHARAEVSCRGTLREVCGHQALFAALPSQAPSRPACHQDPRCALQSGEADTPASRPAPREAASQDPHDDSDADHDSDGDSYGGPDGDSHGDSDGGPDGDSDGDSDTDSHGSPDGDSDTDSHGGPDGDSDTDSHGGPDGDSDTDGNTDGDGDSDTDGRRRLLQRPRRLLLPPSRRPLPVRHRRRRRLHRQPSYPRRLRC